MNDPTRSDQQLRPPKEDLFPAPKVRASLLSRTFMGIGGVLLILIGTILSNMYRN